GAYGVGFLPVTPNFDLLARVGYSKINADGAGPLSGANLDDEGVGYGVGAQYTFATGWGLRGDYTRHDGDRDLNTWGVALTRSF
ncbi:MAG: outer membrane beta-barrel protein, partial [Hyphomonadaceae bacterium]